MARVWLKADDGLSGGDEARDDAINRAFPGNFIGAFRLGAGVNHVQAVMPIAFTHTLREFLNVRTTGGKFNQVQHSG